MMDGLTELAKMFKSRENKNVSWITTGTVVEPLPNIVIKLNDQIALRKENLIVSEHIYTHYRYSSIPRGVYWLEVNDEVLLIPTPDEQTYIILDTVRRLT